MKMITFSGTSLLLVLLLSLFTACKKEIRNETAEGSLSSASALAKNANESSAPAGSLARLAETDLLKSIRNATSRFHSSTQAIKAGYQPDNHCVSVPGLGGMGYHWPNPSLVDPVLDPLNPEVVLYASGPGGNLRLVAIEYIVINIGQARPMLGNKLFDIGGTPVPVPHWSLHVWLYEENPNGIFTPFNPNISCP
jgi:hypothetical protein